MAGVAIELDFNLTRARTAFGALLTVTDDPRPVLDDIGQELERSTVDRFATNIAPDGTPWPRSAGAEERGQPTLVFRSHLRDSVAYNVDGAVAVEIGAGGIAASYAAIHQEGFDGEVQVSAHERRFTMVFGRPLAGVAQVSAHSRHMSVPQRAYLGLSDADEFALEQIAIDGWRDAIVRGIG